MESASIVTIGMDNDSKPFSFEEISGIYVPSYRQTPAISNGLTQQMISDLIGMGECLSKSNSRLEMCIKQKENDSTKTGETAESEVQKPRLCEYCRTASMYVEENNDEGYAVVLKKPERTNSVSSHDDYYLRKSLENAHELVDQKKFEILELHSKLSEIQNEVERVKKLYNSSSKENDRNSFLKFRLKEVETDIYDIVCIIDDNFDRSTLENQGEEFASDEGENPLILNLNRGIYKIKNHLQQQKVEFESLKTESQQSNSTNQDLIQDLKKQIIEMSNAYNEQSKKLGDANGKANTLFKLLDNLSNERANWETEFQVKIAEFTTKLAEAEEELKTEKEKTAEFVKKLDGLTIDQFISKKANRESELQEIIEGFTTKLTVAEEQLKTETDNSAEIYKKLNGSTLDEFISQFEKKAAELESVRKVAEVLQDDLEKNDSDISRKKKRKSKSPESDRTYIMECPHCSCKMPFDKFDEMTNHVRSHNSKGS